MTWWRSLAGPVAGEAVEGGVAEADEGVAPRDAGGGSVGVGVGVAVAELGVSARLE
jgi:hypothetical protein